MKIQWVSLLASAALVAAGLTASPAHATPSGSGSGSLFISDEESMNNGNDPHVGCVFTVEWRNFTPGISSTVSFSPSSQGNGTPDSVTVASGNTTVVTDRDGDQRADYMLAFTGTAHQNNGFKVSVEASNGTNAHGKTIMEHKTIWVTPCDDSVVETVPTPDASCDPGDTGVLRPHEPVERFLARAPQGRLISSYCVLADGEKYTVDLATPASDVWVQTPAGGSVPNQKASSTQAQVQTAGHHGGHKKRGHKKGGRKGGGHDHGDHGDCDFEEGPDTRVVEYSLTFAPVAPKPSPSVNPSTSPSTNPSVTPSASPSASPSVTPSVTPSATPTTKPTPTASPSPEIPFDWDWKYPQPDCTQLFVTYPSALPSGQANDVNIRIRYQDPSGSGEREMTLNFHKEWNDRWNDGDDTSTWSGIKSFVFANHPHWRADLKNFSVVWVQVAGTNYHWGAQPGDEHLECITDGDADTDDVAQQVTKMSPAQVNDLTGGNGLTIAAALTGGSMMAGRTMQLQRLTSADAWETVATSYSENNGAVDFFVPQPTDRSHRVLVPATFRQSSASSAPFSLDVAASAPQDIVAPVAPSAPALPEASYPPAAKTQQVATVAQKKQAKIAVAHGKVSKSRTNLSKTKKKLTQAQKRLVQAKSKAKAKKPTKASMRKAKAAKKAVRVAHRKVRAAQRGLMAAKKNLLLARR